MVKEEEASKNSQTIEALGHPCELLGHPSGYAVGCNSSCEPGKGGLSRERKDVNGGTESVKSGRTFSLRAPEMRKTLDGGTGALREEGGNRRTEKYAKGTAPCIFHKGQTPRRGRGDVIENSVFQRPAFSPWVNAFGYNASTKKFSSKAGGAENLPDRGPVCQSPRAKKATKGVTADVLESRLKRSNSWAWPGRGHKWGNKRGKTKAQPALCARRKEKKGNFFYIMDETIHSRTELAGGGNGVTVVRFSEGKIVHAYHLGTASNRSPLVLDSGSGGNQAPFNQHC